MPRSQYADDPLHETEIRYPVVLEQADLDALANGETVTAPVTLNGVVDITAEFDDSIDRTYYASQNGGRSSGVLHTRRDCRHLKNVPDELIVDGPRERFDEGQDVCGTCGGGA